MAKRYIDEYSYEFSRSDFSSITMYEPYPSIDFDTTITSWKYTYNFIHQSVENIIQGVYQQLYIITSYITKQLHAINSFLVSHFIELSIKLTILQKYKNKQTVILSSNFVYIFKILANIFNKKDLSKNHIHL